MPDAEDKFGEGYFQKLSADFSDPAFEEEFGLIMELLPARAGDKVLDAGCGKGRLGLFFLDQRKEQDVTFSDVTDEAARHVPGRFVKCSMTDTPFRDDEFDRIYSLSTISHINDPDKAMQEMRRIGKAMLLTTNNKWPVYLYKAAHRLGLIKKFKYDSTVLRLYGARSLSRLLERNGWKVAEVRRYGEYPSMLKFGFLRQRLMITAFK